MADPITREITLDQDNVWTNATDLYPELAGRTVTVQNISADSMDVRLVWGGESAPDANNGGLRLDGGDADTNVADNIWLRSANGGGVVHIVESLI